MSEQGGTQTSTLQRPANDDKDAWKAYWKPKGQEWRTKPEIDEERQKYLDERRSIKPDISKGVYPFKDIKLSRADVEWLLATHENGRGPVDWNDENQREREGLDLRGTDLRGVDLTCLPLACICGGFKDGEWLSITQNQSDMMAIHLEGANLSNVHLEGASLGNAHLERANLEYANLKGAYLIGVHLEEAKLHMAHLEMVCIRDALLQDADLSGAFLEEANLIGAHLERAYLLSAQLSRTKLDDAHLEGARLYHAELDGASLTNASFDSNTDLSKTVLGNQKSGFVSLVGIHWGGVDLSVVDWAQVKLLGDEHQARQWKWNNGNIKNPEIRLDQYKEAVRSNRQLSVVLQEQGLNEEAGYFAYRAKRLQKTVLWRQRKFDQYLFSLFLSLIAGYGYKPLRSFIAYLVIISFFAVMYYQLGQHLAWNESIVISMTAFHGRGFFPDQFHPGDPQALVAAIEAFVGLLIEVTFIATLTQRLFGK